MALEDEVKQEDIQDSRLSDAEEEDLEIAVLMAKRLIDNGGFDVIQQAVETSNDPGQVIGQFLMQMVTQMDEQFPPEAKLSKTIYFAHGGWIEQISDFLQEDYGVKKDVMDRAEMYIGAAASKMAQGEQAQQQGVPVDPTAPVTPQPGVV